jgi:dihydropteroate synthase
MRAAARAGARLVIDASPTIDDDTLYTLGDIGLPVVLKRGGPIGVRPKNWHEAVELAAVVHTALESRIEMLEGAGVSRERIIVDPGMDADQPAEENVALLHALSLFHGLGCPISVNCDQFAQQASRSGAATDSPKPPEIAVAALAQGVQLLATAEPGEIWSAAAGFRAIADVHLDETR